MSGKGSAPRPYSVPKETFDQSFERIFGTKDKQKEELSQVKENEQPQTNETSRSG